jgi:uncharacterized protein YodC (DUF2158 family)
MERFKEGDMVQVRGGGPEMLVVGAYEELQCGDEAIVGIFCVWDSDHQLNERVFAPDELDIIRYERRRFARPGLLSVPQS